MNSTTLNRIEPATTPKPHFLDGLAARAVHQRLSGLAHGQVTLVDGNNHQRYGQRDALCPLSVTLQVHDPRFYSDIAFGGSIGAGEAYMQGYWSVNDLTALVRILLQNREVLDGMETGFARLTAPLQKALHWLNRNTRAGSQRNIAAHYDLGNEFFALFLDPTMMYSSAIFPHRDATLEEASLAKLGRICRRLELNGGDHLLEIGTGWGGMAEYAARHTGCRVTTTTISRQQYDYATQRIAAAGLSERVTVLLRDYRELEGQYDKLVSIEMIEAVGHRYLPQYFAACNRLLRPDGLMLLQSILMPDQRYERSRHNVDFIQRYIFPGGFLPSTGAIATLTGTHTDMQLIDTLDITAHYADTLAAWRRRFHAGVDAIRALGYSEDFLRLWDYYFCYCEGGFRERAIGTAQFLLAKPQYRPQPA